jgi:type II secretory ATPase GspE/PulE/Tfp pilus assembly ATPase PilB-like protein
LRHDPDVILIGEIRDAETAQIAVQASLTGHLVFSTLHTNDAPGALTRLVDMGVEPYLVASSLEAVLAQRLVRVLCPHCKQPDDSVTAQSFKIKLGIPGGQNNFQIRRLPRMPQHRIFRTPRYFRMDGHGRRNPPVDFEIGLDGSNPRRCAQGRNADSLAEDGWRLVAAGITTVEEVLSVTTAKEVESATKIQAGESAASLAVAR